MWGGVVSNAIGEIGRRQIPKGPAGQDRLGLYSQSPICTEGDNTVIEGEQGKGRGMSRAYLWASQHSSLTRADSHSGNRCRPRC